MYYHVRRPEQCPECGARRPLRLIWMERPPQEIVDLIEAGRARIARDNPGPDPSPPQWECASCGHRWKDLTDPDQQQLDRIIHRIAGRWGAPR